jgi:hypothetical protein
MAVITKERGNRASLILRVKRVFQKKPTAVPGRTNLLMLIGRSRGTHHTTPISVVNGFFRKIKKNLS